MGERGKERRLRWDEVFAASGASITANLHRLEGDHFTHDHDFVEVALIMGGSGVHRTIHGDREVGAGEAFVLRPGVWHAYRGCNGLEVYNCCFGERILRRELAWTFEDPALGCLLRSSPQSLERRGMVRLRLEPGGVEACRDLLDVLSCLGSKDPSRLRIEGIGCLLLLFGQLSRGISANPAGSPARMRGLVLEGVRLLEEDLAHPWTLSELSGRLSVDRSHLTRLFKADTGLPPMKYLARHRAETAATLLLRTGWQVGRIGAEVGWPDPNYFARRFRTHFGMSPKAYRARLAPPTREHKVAG
jgi:AraC family L-rhamnose operon transcriptional activator RhaR